jgi:hypothetical protein
MGILINNMKIIHTSAFGLIDGCNLVFLVKSKDGDNHQEMKSVVFLEWFENQLMPALKKILAWLC